jgi:uncharacterized protein YktB (UPF0637 family)
MGPLAPFQQEDFAVLEVEGLDARMDAIKRIIRPKLEAYGQHFSGFLTTLTGEEIFPHVAKHARRSVNPPDDTWVAFASNKRGYKKLPHFQIGLWKTHVFIWFAVIYECPIKQEFGKELKNHLASIMKEIPDHFVWSIDHTKPEIKKHGELTENEMQTMIERLINVKKAELLCGVNIPRDEMINLSKKEFIMTIENTFKTLLPLYQLSKKVYSL